MSTQDCSSDVFDVEYDILSDSGYSVQSNHTCLSEPFLPAGISIWMPVNFIAIPFASPQIIAPSNSIEDVFADISTSSNRRLIKWSLPPPVTPEAPLPGWNPMPYGLEVFWQSAFAWFFQPFLAAYGHLWTLEPTELPPLSVDWPWHSASYSAKVRYQCQCKHGWTSKKGKVMFWYRVRRQGEEIVCEALFRLFGQQCQYCHPFSEHTFLTPLWYPEEIENAIHLLAFEVMKSYYGEHVSSGSLFVSERLSQKAIGYSSVPHDSTRCQACQDGCCNSR